MDYKTRKLQHLKHYLHDEPLTVIQSLDLTDENFDLALADLKQKYINQKHVTSQLYYNIKQLPRAANNSTSLRATYSALEGLIIALKSFGYDIDDIPPLATSVIMKYPFPLINQLKTADDITIRDFQKVMATHIQMHIGVEQAATSCGIT